MKTKSSGDALAVGMFGYENLDVFGEEAGGVIASCSRGGFLVNKTS